MGWYFMKFYFFIQYFNIDIFFKIETKCTNELNELNFQINLINEIYDSFDNFEDYV